LANGFALGFYFKSFSTHSMNDTTNSQNNAQIKINLKKWIELKLCQFVML